MNGLDRSWRWQFCAGVVVVGVVNAIFLATLATTSGAQGWRLLWRWDAGWYLGIAQDGYSLPADAKSNLAFFPLLPFLARGLAGVGLSPRVALLTVAWMGTLCAGGAIALVGRRVASAKVGVLLSFLWAVAPRAHVQSMAYTEGLYTAWCALALFFLMQRRWWAAAAMVSLAGLTRPTGLSLVATMGMVVLVAMADAVRRRETVPWRLMGAVMLGAAGFISYWCYVAWRVGRWDGYLMVQARWGSPTSSPWWTAVRMVRYLVGEPYPWRLGFALALCLLVTLILLGAMIVTREHWVLVLFGLLSVALVFSQGNHFESKPRLLLPVFVVWLPVARLLAQMDTRWRTLVLISLAGASIWWGVDTIGQPWWP